MYIVAPTRGGHDCVGKTTTPLSILGNRLRRLKLDFIAPSTPESARHPSTNAFMRADAK